jgi:hypothetical protein
VIQDLDNMLRKLLRTKISDLLGTDAQVSFRPPDEDWRTEVSNLQALAVNLYLVDVRENRKLRSNAQVQAGEQNGQVIYDLAPVRVDCHYLITAWSPAQAGPAVEPILDEHALLYRVMAVLENSQPLNPIRVYGPSDPILNNQPDLFKRDLPSQILPVEGFIKQPEFWGTMGQGHRWRPAIYLIVTLPLALDQLQAGPPVTATDAVVKQPNGGPDQLYIIGGQVIDASLNPPAAPNPVKDVWVQLSQAQPADRGRAYVDTTYTDEQGRFVFRNLAPGEYALAWRAQGLPLPPAPRTVFVPSPSGEYDLILKAGGWSS